MTFTAARLPEGGLKQHWEKCLRRLRRGVADTMKIERVVVGQLDVNCYIVSDGSSPEVMIIDPGDEAERIADRIDSLTLQPKYILFTHAHYDHVCAARELKDKYGAMVAMHGDDQETYRLTADLCVSWGYERDDFSRPDRLLKDGDRISVGGIDFLIIHTPGHTPGGVCLFGSGGVFTGDTLFKGSVGRTDLPGGNTARLMESLKKLAALPPETRVFCGHGEETTIGHETASNPYLNSQFRLKLFG